MTACNGDCNQGRQCDCAPDLPTEFPPFNRRTAAIALIVVALAVAASAFFPMGVLS